MQKQKEKAEQLQSQMNAGGNQNKETSSENENKPLFEREQIKGSPFWIIGNEEQGYCLVFGKYKLSNNFQTKEEVIEHLAIEQYNIIAAMIFCSVDAEVLTFRKDIPEPTNQ